MTIAEQLDELVDAVAGVVPGWTVTRHIGHVVPPCVLIDLPSFVDQTFEGLTADIRVSIIAGGVGDSMSTDPMLDIIPALTYALGSPFTPGRFQLSDAEQFPAYTATIRQSFTIS